MNIFNTQQFHLRQNGSIYSLNFIFLIKREKYDIKSKNGQYLIKAKYQLLAWFIPTLKRTYMGFNNTFVILKQLLMPNVHSYIGIMS